MKTLDVACISGWKLNFLFFRQRGKLMFGCKVNIIDAFDLNRYPVEIDTAVLWGIETQEGKSRFVVSMELIKEL